MTKVNSRLHSTAIVSLVRHSLSCFVNAHTHTWIISQKTYSKIPNGFSFVKINRPDYIFHVSFCNTYRAEWICSIFLAREKKNIWIDWVVKTNANSCNSKTFEIASHVYFTHSVFWSNATWWDDVDAATTTVGKSAFQSDLCSACVFIKIAFQPCEKVVKPIYLY